MKRGNGHGANYPRGANTHVNSHVGVPRAWYRSRSRTHEHRGAQFLIMHRSRRSMKIQNAVIPPKLYACVYTHRAKYSQRRREISRDARGRCFPLCYIHACMFFFFSSSEGIIAREFRQGFYYFKGLSIDFNGDGRRRRETLNSAWDCTMFFWYVMCREKKKWTKENYWVFVFCKYAVLLFVSVTIIMHVIFHL